jgi:hypothetical protein
VKSLDDTPFKRKCIALKINYNTATSYMVSHPEMTENEVISHYISNSYVDWYDNLVINGKIVDFEDL